MITAETGRPGPALVVAPRPRWAVAIKRLIDVAVAALVLVLASPLIAVVVWRVRRTSDGPVLYRQRRLGRGLREFTMLKFRTMWEGTSPEPHRAYVVASARGEARAGARGLHKLDRSADVTPTGRWLRRTSLDELPQLLNVLRGDMSLVGPRPCLPGELECLEARHYARFLVPAGITGLWQVSERAGSTFSRALEIDADYARRWSLLLDLRILARTPAELLRLRTR